MASGKMMGLLIYDHGKNDIHDPVDVVFMPHDDLMKYRSSIPSDHRLTFDPWLALDLLSGCVLKAKSLSR